MAKPGNRPSAADLSDPAAREALIKQGHDCLNEADPVGAMQIAERLLEADHPAGVELKALSENAQGQPKAAIRTLRRGTREYPQNWLLWQLLGNCLSDQGDAKGALTAFDKARAAPGAIIASVDYNRALVLARGADHGAVLEVIAEIEASIARQAVPADFADLPVWVIALKAASMNALGRHCDVLPLSEVYLDRPPAEGAEQAQAAILSERARAMRARGEPDDTVLQTLKQALSLHPGLLDAIDQVRNILRAGHGTCYLTLAVSGRASHAGTRRRFQKLYEVIADDETEALGFIAWFEAECEALEAEILEIDEGPPAHKGVYGISPTQWE